MTLTERLTDILKRGRVPFKDCWAAGSSCLVTLYCEETARKVARMLQAAGWKIRGPVRSYDHAKENKGTCLCPTSVEVWRVGGYLGA